MEIKLEIANEHDYVIPGNLIKIVEETLEFLSNQRNTIISLAFLDEDEIALFLKAGLDINTWGVKNRFRYAYFKEKGVNIVIANKNFKKLKM